MFGKGVKVNKQKQKLTKLTCTKHDGMGYMCLICPQ